MSLRVSLDNTGNLHNVKINETGHIPLTLDYTVWEDGQTGSVTGFSQNGSTNENYRIFGIDPWGKTTVVWEARPDDVSGADGGWNATTIPIDNTKLYRFSTWVKRNESTSGRFYLGCHGYGSVNGVLGRSNGTNYTNPYFWTSTTGFNTEEWQLVVGHIWPAGSGTGSNHPDSGRYTLANGRIGGTNQDFVWRTETTSGRHRSYLYYSTDTTQRQQWVYPRMDVVDGTEPSIEDLLSGFDSNNIETVRSKGGTNNISFDIHSNKTDFGKLMEGGVTRGIVGWWSFDQGADDISGNGNNGTVNGATLTTGIEGQSYSFDGVDDYIIVNENITTGLNDELTISLWMKPESGGSNYRAVIHKGTDSSVGATEYWIGISAGDNITATLGAREGSLGWSSGETTITPTFGQWYHVVITWDGTTVRNYVNGVQQITYTLNSPRDIINQPTRFGSSSNGTNYQYSGLIDDPRIYDRALTPEEVTTLYELTGGSNVRKMKQFRDELYAKGQFLEV